MVASIIGVFSVMTLQDVISLAATGELKNLAIKTDVPTVLDYINLGMIELYKRFPLNIAEYTFTRTLTDTLYTLPTDCMWVLSAYGPAEINQKVQFVELPINDENTPYSVYTVSWNKLQVGPSVATGYVNLIYSANAPHYTSADLAKPIDLPDQFIEPLLNYVGYRGHGAMNGNIQAESNTHYQRFELGCKRILKEGMYDQNSLHTNNRITTRGFV